jgi:hypothetical protein
MQTSQLPFSFQLLEIFQNHDHSRQSYDNNYQEYLLDEYKEESDGDDSDHKSEGHCRHRIEQKFFLIPFFYISSSKYGELRISSFINFS